MITGIIIDSREPDWVQNLGFKDIPKLIQVLDAGDLMAVTDDGHTLLIERKTPDDLLGSIKSGRLFPQMAELVQPRINDQVNCKQVRNWPVLLITGSIGCDLNGNVVTPRGVTGWSFAAVQGALLTIQEMGIFIAYAANDMDYEAAVLRLGERSREEFVDILPARVPNIWSHQDAFISALPGIGMERTKAVMQWAGGVPAHALSGIVDLEIDAPIPRATRLKIRRFLGLKDGQELQIQYNSMEDEVIKDE